MYLFWCSDNNKTIWQFTANTNCDTKLLEFRRWTSQIGLMNIVSYQFELKSFQCSKQSLPVPVSAYIFQLGRLNVPFCLHIKTTQIFQIWKIYVHLLPGFRKPQTNWHYLLISKMMEIGITVKRGSFSRSPFTSRSDDNQITPWPRQR